MARRVGPRGRFGSSFLSLDSERIVTGKIWGSHKIYVNTFGEA